MLLGGNDYPILSANVLGLTSEVKCVVEILRHDIQKFRLPNVTVLKVQQSSDEPMPAGSVFWCFSPLFLGPQLL